MTNRWFLCIFSIAIILRVALSAVNLQANDYHYEVSELILSQGHLPAKEDCFECFQPKLYHVTLAGIWEMLPWKDTTIRIKTGQFINTIAGLLTILIVWRFLSRLSVGEKAKLTAFALIALNPCLLAINGQATNDSFAILFGTAALYCLYSFFISGKTKYFLGLTACAVLTAVSKGTGLVLFLSLVLIFMIRIISSGKISLKPQQSLLSYLLSFLVVFFLIVPFAGEYYAKYKKYGTPFVTNKIVEPAPHFWKETSAQRPGTKSIAGAFFTFDLIDMLRMPVITNGFEAYTRHRTSLWSQLYGRTHFVFFDQWPVSWQTENPRILQLGRVILVLALFPTGIIFWRFIRDTAAALNAVLKRNAAFFLTTHLWMLDLVLWAYLAFIVYLNYLYRDFSWMKSIYIFPSILCVTSVLARGLDEAFRRWSPRVQQGLFITIIVLVELYMVSIGVLIGKLTVSS